MLTGSPSEARPRRAKERPPFECIALLLQGGGALGSYQAGVYQALSEANLHPDWVAGISIGAINAAIIAGNKPEDRLPRLRQFWETASAVVPFSMEMPDSMLRTYMSGAAAAFESIEQQAAAKSPKIMGKVLYM